MGELDARRGTLGVNEAGDARKRLDMLIGPESQVEGRDAPLGDHRGRLHHDETRAALRAGAKMNEMPIVREAVLRRILAHGRDGDAVAEGHAANCKRCQEIYFRQAQILPRAVLQKRTASVLCQRSM